MDRAASTGPKALEVTDLMENRVQIVPPRQASVTTKPENLVLWHEADQNDSCCATMPPTPATCEPEADGSSGDAREDSDEDEGRASQVSIGSSLHATGECRPCAWFWKPLGCLNGKNCLRCHSCPAGEIKRRKKAQMKRLTLSHIDDDESVAADDDVPTSVPSSAVVTPTPQFSWASLASTPQLPPPPAFAPQVSLNIDLPPPPAWTPEEHEEAWPRSDGGEDGMTSLPSVGSRGHGAGQCRPCAWFWKSQGCANGFECGHCHLCAKGEAKVRKQIKLSAIRSSTATHTQTPPEVASEDEDLWRAPPGLGSKKLMPPVPPPSKPPSLPSPGSARHGSGTCMPCIAFLGQSCFNPQSCQYCHLCPSSDLRVIHQASLAGIPLTSFSTSPGLAAGTACENCGGDIFCTCTPADMAYQRPLLRERPQPSKQLQSAPLLTAPHQQPGPLLPAPEKLQWPLPAALDLQPAGPLLPTPQKEPEPLPQPQAGLDAALPSVGSASHASGTCTPCAWFWKPQACKNGSSCGRCHFCGPAEVKRRKKAKLVAMASKSGEVQSQAQMQMSDPASMFIAPCGALILD